MQKKKVIITGGNGQLGKSLKKVYEDSMDNSLELVFMGHDDLDITDEGMVIKALSELKPYALVNCAMFKDTAACEDDYLNAVHVNAEGPEILAHVCGMFDVKFIHISTDYVFDGEKGIPYTEYDIENPLNAYGETKLSGEKGAMSHGNAMVIRTSWLYSDHGNNFVTKAIDKIRGGSMKAVMDQLGSPTNADTLAEVILDVIVHGDVEPGLYQFCNEGVASWYDVACAVERMLGESNGVVELCLSSDFESKVKRPKYSVMSTKKLYEHFPYLVEHRVHWYDALSDVVQDILMSEDDE